MYGLKVHQAVFENGDKESGCTVHYVTSNVDAGEIIAQDKVDISMAKSPEEIQKIVLEREWKLLPRVVKYLIEYKYKTAAVKNDGRKRYGKKETKSPL